MGTSLRRSSFALVVALVAASPLLAQLQGPPAGVPVPAAPMASDRPVAQPPSPVPEGSLHFRIRLLDGRSSLPVRNGRVRLWYDERDTPGYLLTTDDHGEVLLPEPAVTPVRVLIVPEGMYDCRKLSEREPMPGYNLAELGEKGILVPNRCESGSRVAPHRGELTIFARPPRWYEELNRGTAR